MPLHVSSIRAHHQKVKIRLHSLWYQHTYRCDYTKGCVTQCWPPDDEHMCSKHLEAWNKLIVRQKCCASSWLITEINKKITNCVLKSDILCVCRSLWFANKERTSNRAHNISSVVYYITQLLFGYHQVLNHFTIRTYLWTKSMFKFHTQSVKIKIRDMNMQNNFFL